MEKVNRFHELDNNCPMESIPEYYGLAIELARLYCEDIAYQNAMFEDYNDYEPDLYEGEYESDWDMYTDEAPTYTRFW